MSEIDGIRERVALDWQTYSSPTIPEMDRRTLLAAYDALAAELASIKAHSKFQADCGRQTSLALIDAGIKSFGFNADGVKELAAERDALRSRLAEADRLRGWQRRAVEILADQLEYRDGVYCTDPSGSRALIEEAGRE